MATETDKVKTGALGTLVAVGLFATLSIMLAVTALVRYSVHGVADGRAALAEQPYRQLRTEQSGKLSASPVWTDKGQGKVSMPIERAKAKVLAELAKDPSSATPPAPAQPAAAPDAAGADAGAALGEGAPGTVEGEKTPGSAAPAPAAPAPTPTHATLEKKPAPAATVATAKPTAPATAAATAPAAPAAPAPAAPAAPKPTDG